MKKILLIGCGAREHIIAEKLKASSEDVELFVVGPNENPGIVSLSEEYLLASVDDVEAIVDFALNHKVDFAVIGPELPLEKGVVDALERAGVKSASPRSEVAKLETSKGFTRDLLAKYGITGNPKFKVFDDVASVDDLEAWFAELGDAYVVKDDGLRGGKGVKVGGEHLIGLDEGIDYAKECLAGSGRVVVEEKLVGQEFSVLFFCDGVTVIPMPVVQDHKRAFDGDVGPNTGGMGTYSFQGGSLPFLSDDDLLSAVEITEKVVAAVHEETGVKYVGVLYGGFMAVADGVRLIEYNARYGDPEAMNVLTLLDGDLVEICEAMIDGKLDEVEVLFSNMATVCKYVVPQWYPDGVRGDADNRLWLELPVDSVLDERQLQVYLGSVEEVDGELRMLGSRAVAFVGIGATLEEAERIAQSGVEMVRGAVRYRSDIGKAAVIEEKIQSMNGFRKNS
ncbi:phosphoribosylamine--glycine ligase [Candidatus Peregrinibacteria bacterium HGW-Peregrinibacteria-1]|jgi:phosphoribosylamine--glycine ligase|nr:MAG: phosphoribosylamine--glycine ligase [Candidatus Peregrinibacteria bacterium HGW-Peregrinibacteria-1]